MKRILFLGGAPMQVPPLQYARQQGHYVITCDYLPDNPGHRLAHEYHNVSTTDKEAVLAVARAARVDGIVAYASDPAAPTAAYVGNALGLPSNPYEAVLTLTRKDLFRRFLRDHGFHVPRSEAFDCLAEARAYARTLALPIFVKPVDSSGSKGVTQIYDLDDFAAAYSYALSFSRAKWVVVEERIVRQGYQVAGDGFVVDGQLAFRCFANEHFDHLCNGLVPIGESFPAIHDPRLLDTAHRETQRLLTLLGMKTGALNFDFVFTEAGELFFLELGPRNGGNLIPEVIRYVTGVDLVKYTVDAALGEDCSGLQMKLPHGYYSSYIVHALQEGKCRGLQMTERFRGHLVEENIWVKKGNPVRQFRGSNDTLGTAILRFESEAEMLAMMDHMEEDLCVKVAPRAARPPALSAHRVDRRSDSRPAEQPQPAVEVPWPAVEAVS
jgi:biotin carboxylase